MSARKVYQVLQSYCKHATEIARPSQGVAVKVYCNHPSRATEDNGMPVCKMGKCPALTNLK